MQLSAGDVEKLSLLARLELSPQEVAALTTQLGQILDYVRQLEELDIRDVEPLAHAIDLQDVLVDDQPEPCLEREQALANAPNRDEECYRVPAVLGS
jgi:aspartyl-tRNA(Asn)/glutamyl-tRNA(Gln) amidotransferase subunit C